LRARDKAAERRYDQWTRMEEQIRAAEFIRFFQEQVNL
jgi:hypothetical protein